MNQTYSTKVPQEIIDKQAKLTIIDQDIKNDILCVSYWKDETLQALKENSGVVAKSNEYAVHYWAVNLTKSYDDNSKLIIHIPVLFFNYPQENSVVACNYFLPDAKERSDMLKPLAKKYAQNLLNELKAKQLFVGFEPDLVSMNTLHKHP